MGGRLEIYVGHYGTALTHNGIATCRIAIDVEEERESVYG